jgi:hypothetical protein
MNPEIDWKLGMVKVDSGKRERKTTYFLRKKVELQKLELPLAAK